jgi:hypothetical protein
MSDPVIPSSAIEAELAALSLVFSRETGAEEASGRWVAELDPELDSTLKDLRVRAQALGADQADERSRLGDTLEGVSDMCDAWRAVAAQARQVRGSRVQSAVGESAAALSGALVARWDAMLSEAAGGGEDKLPLVETLEARREQLLTMKTEAEEVDKAVKDAGKEFTLETTAALTGMYSQWEGMELNLKDYRNTGTYVLTGSEEIVQQLGDQITMTQVISFSPFKGVFEQQIADWNRKLNTVSEVIDEWLACQRTWMYLEPLFGSEDIMRQLPREGKMFQTVDQKWRKNMSAAKKNPGVISFCSNDKLLVDFQESNKLLELVSKGVDQYLEETRVAFPRFYFWSNDELLEIKAAGRRAQGVLPQLRKLFEGLADLHLEADGSAGTAMVSGDGAVVEFETPLALEGRRPEEWLPELEIRMRESLKLEQQITIEAHADTPHQEWVMQGCGEMVLLVSAIEHTLAVDAGLDQGTLQAYKHEVATQIETLCNLANKNLTKTQKAVTGSLAVLVVHWREEVARLLDCGAQQRESFERQVQLKYRLDSRTKAATIHMLDFSQNYGCALNF